MAEGNWNIMDVLWSRTSHSDVWTKHLKKPDWNTLQYKRTNEILYQDTSRNWEKNGKMNRYLVVWLCGILFEKTEENNLAKLIVTYSMFNGVARLTLYLILMALATFRSDFLRLTHWSRVMHKCVSKLTIIGSDNGLSPGRCQAIIWTNTGIFLIGPLETIISEIFIAIHTFSFKKMHLKISSGKWRPFCLGLSVLSVMVLKHPQNNLCCQVPSYFVHQNDIRH